MFPLLSVVCIRTHRWTSASRVRWYGTCWTLLALSCHWEKTMSLPVPVPAAPPAGQFWFYIFTICIFICIAVY